VNPFEGSGPEFLVFYAFFGAAVLALAYAFRPDRRAGDLPAPPIDPTDPYEIAFLRAGSNEALRVATLSLVDRGLLEVTDAVDTKHEPELQAQRDARDKVRRPIEVAVLDHFGDRKPADSVFGTTKIDSAIDRYRERLESLGLLPTEAERQSRLLTKRIAWGALWLVAGARIFQALGNERSNVLFLIVFAAALSWAVSRVVDRPRTGAGDRALAQLRALFAGLRAGVDRLSPGGATNEVALVAGVYGVGTLPDERFPFVRKLYKRATVARSSGTACGSGCGGGGGGDGGDGGDGCGGGCGGCGL
jgi:uncharacterized protein (TIGR04222 family)